MSKQSILALAVSLSIGSACGGDDGSSSAALLANVCDSNDGVYIKLFSKAFSCVPEIELFVGSFPDDDELEEACEGSLADYIEDGFVVVERASALQECLDYIDNTPCETFEIDAPNPCDEYLGGTQDAGEDCDDDIQCSGDSFCDKSESASCGECVAQKANGENCFDDVECRAGRCSGVDGNNAGMCRAFGDVGDDCSDGDDCLGLLECNDTTGKCQTPQQWSVGDSCAAFEECGFPSDSIYCDASDGECKAYAAVGESCGDTQLCNFIRYEICNDATSMCEPPSIVGIGDSCGLFLGRKCDDGLICDFAPDSAAGDCVAIPSPGDSCVDDDDCGGLLLSCVNSLCQYGEYTGMCPLPEGS